MKKIDKQFNELQRRGVKVSYEQFQNYYEVTRKANAKMNRLYNNPNSMLLNKRKISTNVAFIQNQKDFHKAYEARKTIVSKGFISKDNAKTRKRLKSNLTKMFGRSKKAKSVIDKIVKLNNKDLKQFMSENRDLAPLMWYYEKELIEKLDIKLDDVKQRLENFTGSKIRTPNIASGEDFTGGTGKIKKPKVKKKKRSRRNTYEESLKEFHRNNPDLFKF